MKKVFLLALSVALIFTEAKSQLFVYSHPTTIPSYSGSTVRALYERINGKPLVLNITQNNLGNAASDYLVTVDACNGAQTAITVLNLNTATSTNACFFGFAQSTQRKDTSVVFGNSISSATGMNCLLAFPDATENTYTLSDMFQYTGSNKANAQVSGATFLPNGLLRIWSNSVSASPVEINGVNVPFFADLNLVTGVVTPRPDLTPSLTGVLAGGSVKVFSVDVTSNGEVITLGYFNTRAGIFTAQKGYIENLSTAVITDLSIDNDLFVYCTQYKEIAGVGFIGYTNQNPPGGLSSGLVKFNPTNYVISNCGGIGFGINVQDLVVTPSGRLRGVGSPRTTPAGGTVFEYNPANNTFYDISSGLFNSPGASSSVTNIVNIGCSNCNMLAGNFSSSFAPGTPRASTFTDLAKGCNSVPLAVKTTLSAQRFGKDVLLQWKEGITGAVIEKSFDGINYSALKPINSATGTYTDMNGGGYYRISHNGEYTRGIFVKMLQSETLVQTYNHKFVITFPRTTQFEIINTAGQVLQNGKTKTIEVFRGRGILFLKTETEVIKLPN